MWYRALSFHYARIRRSAIILTCKLPLCQIVSVASSVAAWATPRRQIGYSINQSITPSLLLLIWCDGNRSFRFGKVATMHLKGSCIQTVDKLRLGSAGRYHILSDQRVSAETASKCALHEQFRLHHTVTSVLLNTHTRLLRLMHVISNGDTRGPFGVRVPRPSLLRRQPHRQNLLQITYFNHLHANWKRSFINPLKCSGVR